MDTVTDNLTITERVIRRDRTVTISGLALLGLLAWVYIVAGAGTGMSTLGMSTWQFPPPVTPDKAMAWSSGYWVIMTAMWWVMMIAMMVPSAAPMILLYARVSRRAQDKGTMAPGVPPVSMFVLGYLAIWLLFSLIATTAQWWLEKLGVVHQMTMWSTSNTLTGLLLITAGLYQLTPAKAACLEHCRSPADYLSRNWRSGKSGAFRMGVKHGAYCIGCCWALMLLLFAGGIMNLVWIAGLTLFVLFEKLAPWGHRLGHGLGLVLTGGGCWLLFSLLF